MVRFLNTIQESALDTAGRHREQKNEKLKSRTKRKYIGKRR